MTELISRKEFQIRILTKADKVKVEQLLRETFAKASGFSTDPIVSKWSVSDDYYPCFGIFAEENLLAYMRAEWISSDQELLIKIGEPENQFKFAYPIGHLAKAATHPSMQSKGLNLILRYHALRLFKYWKVSSVIGTMVEGSARIQTMRKLGYYFFSKKKKWNGIFSSDRNVLLAILDGNERISAALEQIESQHADVIAKVDVEFSLSQIPMIGRTDTKFPWDKKANAS